MKTIEELNAMTQLDLIRYARRMGHANTKLKERNAKLEADHKTTEDILGRLKDMMYDIPGDYYDH